MKLPVYLDERIRQYSTKSTLPEGEFVLYWMHNAIRTDENPALDVAIQLSEQLGQPLLVYQGLSERYPFASDRHHAFLMQGAQDVQHQCQLLGIPYVFHLERDGQRGPHLKTLANRASVVITEDFPTEPIIGWLKSLSDSTMTPIWLVDTACVVPMNSLGKAYDRAFAFRDKISAELEKRVSQPWPKTQYHGDSKLPENLPFEPIDLQSADHASLIAECDIDHAVSPIPHTLGGSVAGYARWEDFRQNRLRRYADDRNDATRNGVSRMSAYLHVGMVSPFRLARECAETPGKGAEKYLDELIIWRELAYNFCRYKADHASINAIPKWARQTLQEHQADHRPALYDWETLARGQTEDEFWNAMQWSLLQQGELHNNVRMTWGKAFLPWTTDAETALARMIDLNHRYALDSRDPASYGGLLWCLGQFDRPHTPASRIFGTVRTRPLGQHAARLNVQEYTKLVTRPWHQSMPKVAVIGAGITGLMAARTLQDHGFPVTVFEKSRGPSGRSSTRRIDNELSFDHGAQYFTARHPVLQRYVTAWQEAGIVAEWTGRIVKLENQSVSELNSETTRYVGVPGMNALGKHLAQDCEIQYGRTITRIVHDSDRWQLFNDNGESLGQFDELILAIPAPQTAMLLDNHPLGERAKSTTMTPCWSVMAAFVERLPLPWDGAFVHGSPLSWVARNSSKPGRNEKLETWVLQANAEWSQTHLERDPAEVSELLLQALTEATGLPMTEPYHQAAHRWRYSAGGMIHPTGAAHDEATSLTVAGDWLQGGRIEGAFLSGVAAAGFVLRRSGMPRLGE